MTAKSRTKPTRPAVCAVPDCPAAPTKGAVCDIHYDTHRGLAHPEGDDPR